jgi:hypothetical protein
MDLQDSEVLAGTDLLAVGEDPQTKASAISIAGLVVENG